MNITGATAAIMKRNPIDLIEFVIGVSSILGGLYLLSPFLKLSTILNGASPLVIVLGSQVGILIFGLAFLLSGLAMVIGVILNNKRVRSRACFSNAFVRAYSIIGTLLVQGLLPLTWLTNLTVLLVTVVCYLYLRQKLVSKGK